MHARTHPHACTHTQFRVDRVNGSRTAAHKVYLFSILFGLLLGNCRIYRDPTKPKGETRTHKVAQ